MDIFDAVFFKELGFGGGEIGFMLDGGELFDLVIRTWDCLKCGRLTFGLRREGPIYNITQFASLCKMKLWNLPQRLKPGHL